MTFVHTLEQSNTHVQNLQILYGESHIRMLFLLIIAFKKRFSNNIEIGTSLDFLHFSGKICKMVIN
jgi:hypothetical protein